MERIFFRKSEIKEGGTHPPNSEKKKEKKSYKKINYIGPFQADLTKIGLPCFCSRSVPVVN
jgi:hypothetical protein